MSGYLRVDPLSPQLEPAWDEFASSSEEAWFWQTTLWIHWASEIAGGAFVGGRSFLIRSAREILAVCPVNIEQRGEDRTFSFLGEPIPAPAFKNGLDPAEREHALRLYVQTVEDMARQEDVTYVSVKMPFTEPRQSTPWAVNPWLRFGYFDLPYLTQVVDLRRSEDELWDDVRKGHRSDVKRAAQRAVVRIWDASTLSKEKYSQYQALHAKDAGRTTRSQRTFDMMEGWIRSGYAVLAETQLEGQPAAFAVVIHYKTGAYYGSSCRDPELAAFPGSHLLQWEVMRWLKQRGCELYDLGMQYAGLQWFCVPTPKELSIAGFKRGFGGRTVPMVIAERFFDGEALRRRFDARVREYLAAKAGRVAEV